jgi:lipoprotein NlpD
MPVLLCGCIPPAAQPAYTPASETPPPANGAASPQPAAPEAAPAPGTVQARAPSPPPANRPGSFAWPLRGAIVTRFGMRPGGTRSDGIQIAAAAGTPVRAVADGVVSYTGRDVPALGTIVVVRHGGDWMSVYGHAAKVLVSDGERVKQGQPIALAGKSGDAAQPGLYLELRQGRTPVDPLSRLAR